MPKKSASYSSDIKAFTILELLIVIAVLSVIIGIAIPRIKGMQEQGNVTKVKGELKTMKAALESYYTFSTPSAYPPTSSSVGASYLTQAAPRILSSVLYDPFAVGGVTEYNYKLSSNGKYYVVWSVGLDKTNAITAISIMGGVALGSGDDLYNSNSPAKGDLGAICSDGADCQSTFCVYPYLGQSTWTCTAGSVGSMCGYSNLQSCNSGWCDVVHHSCKADGSNGSGCLTAADCQSGNCNGGTFLCQ